MAELSQLTAAECKVYEFIRRRLRHQRRAPSQREIAAHCGLKSRASVAHYLDALEQKGLIIRERGKVRAISLPRHPVAALPLLGRIGAGGLQEAIEDPELLDIGAILGEGCVVVKVEDDSLVGLAITAGSFLVIDPTCGWRKVVAMIRPIK